MSAAELERQVARLEARCVTLLAVNAELAADLAAAREAVAASRGAGGAALHVIDAETEASRLAESLTAARAATEAALAERDALAAELASCQSVLDSNFVRLREQEEAIAALRAHVDSVDPALAAAEARVAEQDEELSDAASFRSRRGVRAAVWLADHVPRRR